MPSHPVPHIALQQYYLWALKACIQQHFSQSVAFVVRYSQVQLLLQKPKKTYSVFLLKSLKSNYIYLRLLITNIMISMSYKRKYLFVFIHPFALWFCQIEENTFSSSFFHLYFDLQSSENLLDLSPSKIYVKTRVWRKFEYISIFWQCFIKVYSFVYFFYKNIFGFQEARRASS